MNLSDVFLYRNNRSSLLAMTKFFKKGMDLKFSKLNKIGTMVALGRIFSVSKGSTVDLKRFAAKLPCDGKIIKYVDLWYDKKRILRGTVPSTNTKSKKAPKKKGGFANCFAHDLNTKEGSVRCTVFCNGELLVSGLVSNNQRIEVFETLDDIYASVSEASSNASSNASSEVPMFSEPINVQYERFVMIQHTIKIDKDMHDTLLIDNNKLLKYLRDNHPEDYHHYEPKEVRSLETIKDGINYMVFQKGTVNVTGINNIDDIDKSIRYMTKFLNDNIDKFMMNDVVLNAIRLLEEDKNSPEQKSEEWLKARHGAVTASEFAPIVGMGFKGKRMTTYISDKVKRIKGEKKFTGNQYTRRGEIYEDIAIKCYAYKINSDKSRKYNVVIKEIGLVKHKINTFIGASADAIVFMLSEKVPDIRYDTDLSVEELYKLYKDDKIVGVYLMEIKCPYTYHVYDSELCHGLKCVKIKNGHTSSPDGKAEPYVRQEYYCQMQQQCYVLDITMNVMANNHFKEYFKMKEFLSDDRKDKLKGVILKIWGVDEKNKFLPVAIYPDNIICDLSLYKNPEEIINQVISELYDKLWRRYRVEILTGKIYKTRIVYWIHDHWVYTEVPYDKRWYESKISEIKQCFDLIQAKIKEDEEVKKKLEFIRSQEDPLSGEDELSDNEDLRLF